MAAASGFKRNTQQAEGARLFSRRLFNDLFDRLLATQTVNGADQQEYRERDNHETDDRVQEDTIVQSDRARLLGHLQSDIRPLRITLLEHHKQVREVHTADQQTQQRVHDVVDQAVDDQREGTPDNDAHRHIDDIAFNGKLTELFQELGSHRNALCG